MGCPVEVTDFNCQVKFVDYNPVVGLVCLVSSHVFSNVNCKFFLITGCKNEWIIVETKLKRVNQEKKTKT